MCFWRDNIEIPLGHIIGFLKTLVNSHKILNSRWYCPFRYNFIANCFYIFHRLSSPFTQKYNFFYVTIAIIPLINVKSRICCFKNFPIFWIGRTFLSRRLWGEKWSLFYFAPILYPNPYEKIITATNKLIIHIHAPIDNLLINCPNVSFFISSSVIEDAVTLLFVVKIFKQYLIRNKGTVLFILQ